jgi:hypothetical protein
LDDSGFNTLGPLYPNEDAGKDTCDNVCTAGLLESCCTAKRLEGADALAAAGRAAVPGLVGRLGDGKEEGLLLSALGSSPCSDPKPRSLDRPCTKVFFPLTSGEEEAAVATIATGEDVPEEG